MDYNQGPTIPSHDDYKAPSEELDTEFKRKYPPDPLGKEMDDAARVWKVYRDEAMAYDGAMLDGWSQTLDILLIFAGLFSAVATAFVIESYKLLQFDNTAYMAAALYIIASASNSSAALSLPVPPVPDPSVTDLSRWINGLWFTSILLSLSVALLCILVKQWIGEYRARNNASAQSPRHWAHRRELYFQALNAWPVAELVSVLPVLLHIALFLFFAGVVAFLWTLDRVVGVWTIVLGTSIALFYICCTLIPLWIPECPTSTPLVHQLRQRAISLALSVIRIFIIGLNHIDPLTKVTTATLSGVYRFLRQLGWQKEAALNSNQSVGYHQSTQPPILPIFGAPNTRLSSPRRSLIEQLNAKVACLTSGATEKSHVSGRLTAARDELDSSSLLWLISSVSDSDAVAVALQALGGVRPESALAERLRDEAGIAQITFEEATVRSAATTVSPLEVIRIARSVAFRNNPYARMWLLYSPFLCPLRTGDAETVPDAALIAALRNEDVACIADNAAAWRARSPSMTPTAVLLLRLHGWSLDCVLHILLCVSFEDLNDAEWNMLFTVLLRSSGSSTHSTCFSRIHSPFLAHELSLSDVLAQMITRDIDIELTQLAARLIHRLLPLVIRRLQADGFKLDADGFKLEVLPFLSRCLASPQFFLGVDDPGVFHAVISLLRSTYAGRDRLSLDKMPMLQMHLRAFSYALHGSTHGDSERPVGYPLYSDTVQFCVAILGCVPVLPPYRTTLTTVRFVVHRDPSLLMRHSIWEMMTAARDMDVLQWLWLAESLAVALCRLGGRTTAEIDAFFAQCSWLNVVQAARSPQVPDWSHSAEHLVQHCMELRPQWWPEGQASQVHDKGDEDQRLFALELETEVSRRGVCTDCTHVLSGRRAETDGESGSRCSLDPRS